jgi:probable F420-dependent oxidoreductase
MDLTGIGIWSSQLRYGNPAESADAAAELDELGFRALWIPDVGGAVFEAVGNLLAATKQTTVATGILNLWMHTPTDVAASYAELTAAHGDRFLLGIGVSHAPVVDAGASGRYRKPLAATASFLDELDTTPQPVPAERRVLAALGPKMLSLSARRSAGAHPYLVTPEHTAVARGTLGDGPLLLPEQTVILTDTPRKHALSEPTGCVRIWRCRTTPTICCAQASPKTIWRRSAIASSTRSSRGVTRRQSCVGSPSIVRPVPITYASRCC